MQTAFTNAIAVPEQLDFSPEDDYWTTAEAVSILSKSERIIRRLLQAGAMRGFKVSVITGLVWRVEPVFDSFRQLCRYQFWSG